MRILVLMGHPHHIGQALELKGSDVTVRRASPGGATVFDAGTEVVFRVVATERDVDALQGLRFDLMIEHDTFNPSRSPNVWRLADRARMIVLR